MATIKDVARRVGVSVSTVSHALSGKRHVSDDTRARVFQAIEELGYQPNTYAQAMVTGRTNILGMLFPLEGAEHDQDSISGFNTIQLEMLMEANAVAQSRGYALQLYTKAEDEAALRSLCHICDGLLVSAVRMHDARIDYLLSEDYPFVMLGRPAQPTDVAWVDTDFEDMVHQQIKHLVELNHRNIVLLDRPERLFKEQLGYSVRARQGYLHACAFFGLTPIVYTCEISVEDGRQMMHQILDAHPAVTALAAFNDAAAVGAYFALPERGLQVPKDFSLITFTSRRFLQATMPTMTTMLNTGSLVSRTAAEMLVKLLHNETLEGTGILVKSQLLPGRTTAIARQPAKENAHD